MYNQRDFFLKTKKQIYWDNICKTWSMLLKTWHAGRQLTSNLIAKFLKIFRLSLDITSLPTRSFWDYLVSCKLQDIKLHVETFTFYQYVYVIRLILPKIFSLIPRNYSYNCTFFTIVAEKVKKEDWLNLRLLAEHLKHIPKHENVVAISACDTEQST